MVGKLLSGIAAGFIVALLGYLLAGFVMISLGLFSTYVGPILLLGIWLLSIIVSPLFSKTSRVWGYGMVLSGLLAMALPLAVVILVGTADPIRAISELSFVVGALLGSSAGAEIASLLSFAGLGYSAIGILVFGLLLIALALVFGFKQEVVIRNRPDAAPPDIENIITAKEGTYTYRVMAYCVLPEEQLMEIVWQALEDGRLKQPKSGESATPVTSIGKD